LSIFTDFWTPKNPTRIDRPYIDNGVKVEEVLPHGDGVVRRFPHVDRKINRTRAERETHSEQGVVAVRIQVDGLARIDPCTANQQVAGRTQCQLYLFTINQPMYYGREH